MRKPDKRGSQTQTDKRLTPQTADQPPPASPQPPVASLELRHPNQPKLQHPPSLNSNLRFSARQLPRHLLRNLKPPADCSDNQLPPQHLSPSSKRRQEACLGHPQRLLHNQRRQGACLGTPLLRHHSRHKRVVCLGAHSSRNSSSNSNSNSRRRHRQADSLEG